MLGGKLWYIIWACIPPRDEEYLRKVEQALLCLPENIYPLLLEDLNVHLAQTWDAREGYFAVVLSQHSLKYLHQQFLNQQCYWGRGVWTCWQQLLGGKVTSTCNYLLGNDRFTLVSMYLKVPWLDTDHRIIFGAAWRDGGTENKRYVRGKARCLKRFTQRVPLT